MLRALQGRTVVFDIGGVLLDWDPRNLYRTVFSDPNEMEWFLSEVCAPAWNLAQDGGRSWSDAETEAIARHPGFAEQIRLYRKRWHEMIPGPIGGTVDLLHDLHAAGVPLYAITNFASDTFAEARERFQFLKLFRGVVVSGAERLLKPDPRLYHRLTEIYGVNLADAVFIDDNPENCKASRSCGMRAIRFVDPEQVRAALADLV
jgi:2-haloacid dehalogenase